MEEDNSQKQPANNSDNVNKAFTNSAANISPNEAANTSSTNNASSQKRKNKFKQIINHNKIVGNDEIGKIANNISVGHLIVNIILMLATISLF